MATPEQIAAARDAGFRNSLSHLKPDVVEAMKRAHTPLAARRDKNVREFVGQVLAGRKTQK
jgi:hypothetical protein